MITWRIMQKENDCCCSRQGGNVYGSSFTVRPHRFSSQTVLVLRSRPLRSGVHKLKAHSPKLSSQIQIIILQQINKLLRIVSLLIPDADFCNHWFCSGFFQLVQDAEGLVTDGLPGKEFMMHEEC